MTTTTTWHCGLGSSELQVKTEIKLTETLKLTNKIQI